MFPLWEIDDFFMRLLAPLENKKRDCFYYKSNPCKKHQFSVKFFCRGVLAFPDAEK